MNRCVKCGGPLEFVGISQRPTHFRWDLCPLCGQYHVSNGEGDLRMVTAEEPDKRIFRVPADPAPEPVLKVKKVETPKSAPGCGIGAY